MNTQITIDHLTQLKLHGMVRAYQAVLSMPVQQQPTLSQFMANLAVLSGTLANNPILSRNRIHGDVREGLFQ